MEVCYCEGEFGTIWENRMSSVNQGAEQSSASVTIGVAVKLRLGQGLLGQ